MHTPRLERLIIENLSDDTYYLWENYNSVSTDMGLQQTEDFKTEYLNTTQKLIDEGKVVIFEGDRSKNNVREIRVLNDSLENYLDPNYCQHRADIVFRSDWESW